MWHAGPSAVFLHDDSRTYDPLSRVSVLACVALRLYLLQPFLNLSFFENLTCRTTFFTLPILPEDVRAYCYILAFPC